MAIGKWTLTNTALTNILNGTIDLTGAFKVALVGSGSNISTSSTTWAGVTEELPYSHGYVTDGVDVSLNISGNPAFVSFNVNPFWFATGGSLVARWAVLYQPAGRVLAFCLLDTTPADVTTTAGNTLLLDSDGTPNPILSFTAT